MVNSTLFVDGEAPATSLHAGIIRKISDDPYRYSLFVFALLCVFTRVLTGWRSVAQPSTKYPGSKSLRVLPYWIPYLGHAIPFAVGFQQWLGRIASKEKAGCFAIVIGNGKHNIVTAPSLTKQLLDGRAMPLNARALTYHMMTHFFKDGGAIKAMGEENVWGPVHGVLKDMLKESFVVPAIQQTLRLVEERTSNLVSGTDAFIDQTVWERAGKISIVSRMDGKNKYCSNFVAEADMHHLLRDFVGDIATYALMGHNFVENYPDLMEDLWTHDDKFSMCLLTVPDWVPGMGKAAAARERLIAAVTEHHDALKIYLDGGDPGPKWSDMSDCSTVMMDRMKAMAACNASPRGYAIADLAILWAMNINANQIIFWALYYLYSQPSVLQEVREEIKPFVKLRNVPETGLPVREVPKLDIDLQSLAKNCPILKGVFFETMRLEAMSTSYKYIEEDIVMTESVEDAKALGKSEPDSWVLPKGELVCMPHAVHQGDGRFWNEAEVFDPRRFWLTPDGQPLDEKSEKEIDPQDVRIDYRTMKVWGGGKYLCKGKAFAEREVVLFVAAIITAWDLEPASNGGKWVHPGRKVGGSSNVPKNPLRVRMTRREGW